LKLCTVEAAAKTGNLAHAAHVQRAGIHRLDHQMARLKAGEDNGAAGRDSGMFEEQFKVIFALAGNSHAQRPGGMASGQGRAGQSQPSAKNLSAGHAGAAGGGGSKAMGFPVR
jgi:hypothetical protein